MRVGIIGGGAAGMMCAASVLHHTQTTDTHDQSDNFHNIDTPQIHLFEKNSRLGAKVIISGGGRCNVTTGIVDKKILLTKYIRGSEFLRQALGVFGPTKIMQWFEDHGVPLKVEDDMRVFPVSDNGKDVVGAFEHLFAAGNAHIHAKCGVTQIEGIQSESGGVGSGFRLTTETGIYEVDRVVVTTGGEAYRHTGSTGDGYAFAEMCGHTITPLGPSLSSFFVEEQWIKDLSGIAFSHAAIRFTDLALATSSPKIVVGSLLCTHFGISGPVVFSLSAHVPYMQIDKEHPLIINVVLEAGVPFEMWDQRFVDRAKTFPTRQIKTQLHTIFPERVVEKICEVVQVDPTQQLANFTKEHRKRMIHALVDGIPVTVLSRRPGDEFVTAGGVTLSQIDPKTMQSKIVPGLYFAGEVLDIDGLTGGFNLTSSRATGRVAGKSIAQTILQN